ncbi:MAG: hypothetical protein ACI8YC_001048, partial [Salibacteraceae bacterium]
KGMFLLADSLNHFRKLSILSISGLLKEANLILLMRLADKYFSLSQMFI